MKIVVKKNLAWGKLKKKDIAVYLFSIARVQSIIFVYFSRVHWH